MQLRTANLVVVTPVNSSANITESKPLGRGAATVDARAPSPSPNTESLSLTHVSTRWAGRCFFCGDTTAHYAVPVCASWGGWAAWRTEMELAIETEDYDAIQMLKV